jgi:ATP-dependent RNA helicase DDX56/DBP9
MVVIDEADLILSYGYQDDITTISKFLPKICQGFLMSATLSPEVEGLKKTILHTPVILRLEEEQRSADSLQQFVVDIPEDDKFLLLYVLLKLKLLKGKVIVFVNSIDRCFKYVETTRS